MPGTVARPPHRSGSRPRGRARAVVVGVLGLVLLLVAAVAVVVTVVTTRTSPEGPGTAPAPATSWTPRAGETVLRDVYTTGYTWFDNTPPGSASISHPQVHRKAGGTGTYDDPITLAVGHSLASGSDVLDLPAGTRVYVPHVRRYFVVEDTCGDGATPQRRGCHDLTGAPEGATLWIDLYIGGSDGDDRKDVQQCAGRVTDGDAKDLHVVVLAPRPDYAVAGYPIFHDGECSDLFPGDPSPSS